MELQLVEARARGEFAPAFAAARSRAGALFVLGNSLFFSYRAEIDKILKGARPADLPIQEPARFEMVVNLKTAKELGLAIPGSILSRADRIIQ